MSPVPSELLETLESELGPTPAPGGRAWGHRCPAAVESPSGRRQRHGWAERRGKTGGRMFLGVCSGRSVSHADARRLCLKSTLCPRSEAFQQSGKYFPMSRFLTQPLRVAPSPSVPDGTAAI